MEYSSSSSDSDSDEDLQLMAVALIALGQRKKKKRKHRFWVKEIYKNRDTDGIQKLETKMRLSNRESYFKKKLPSRSSFSDFSLTFRRAQNSHY
jgi:hypothetical protein